MEKLSRAIFFWILVLIFMVSAPAVVFYARGYRFDFSRGVFVHSGTISIKSNPQDIQVIINGKIADSKALNHINNSYNISGLMPDIYDISVSADGYQTWNKKSNVHSGLASEFWNVTLARNNYAKTEYPTPNIEKFFISPQSKFLIYTENNEKNLTAKILDIKDKEVVSTFVFEGWNFISDERKENIEWSPEEDYISVPVQKTLEEKINTKTKIAPDSDSEPRYSYFIIDTVKKTSLNLNEILKVEDINYVRWDPKDKNYLFYLSEDKLFRANINNTEDIIEIAQDISSFDLSKTNVYYSQMPNELVYKAELNGTGNRIQLTSDFPEDITRNFRLIAYDDNRIAFFTKNKTVYIFNDGELDRYFKKLGTDIEGIQFSDDGKKLLYWTKNQISVHYLRNWNVEPKRSENTSEDITRYADEIKNIQWFGDYEHVIFSLGKQLKFVELDPRDHRNSMDLIQASIENPLATYNHYLEKLFFIENVSSSSNLNSINFPETLPFLGIFNNQDQVSSNN